MAALSTTAAKAYLAISGLRQRRSRAAQSRASAQHGSADTVWQRSRPLQFADQRHQNQHVEEVVERGDLADSHHDALRRAGADPAERDHVDHQEPKDPFVDRPEAGAAYWRGIEPRQQEQYEDCR